MLFIFSRSLRKTRNRQPQNPKYPQEYQRLTMQHKRTEKRYWQKRNQTPQRNEIHNGGMTAIEVLGKKKKIIKTTTGATAVGQYALRPSPYVPPLPSLVRPTYLSPAVSKASKSVAMRSAMHAPSSANLAAEAATAAAAAAMVSALLCSSSLAYLASKVDDRNPQNAHNTKTKSEMSRQSIIFCYCFSVITQKARAENC